MQTYHNVRRVEDDNKQAPKGRLISRTECRVEGEGKDYLLQRTSSSLSMDC